MDDAEARARTSRRRAEPIPAAGIASMLESLALAPHGSVTGCDAGCDSAAVVPPRETGPIVMRSDSLQTADTILRNDRPFQGRPLVERVLYVPRMSFGASRCFSAAVRSFGIDARPFPASDARTLELGNRFTSGDECFPERITLGDALKVVLAPGADPSRIAFFMPTAPGPCRFGQYAPFLRRVLDSVGAADAMVVSPTSGSGYDEFQRPGQGAPARSLARSRRRRHSSQGPPPRPPLRNGARRGGRGIRAGDRGGLRGTRAAAAKRGRRSERSPHG